MKSIKGKIFFVYLLVIVSIGTMIFSSYIAVDTNSQHLMLSELLAMQRLHVEKVVMTTESLSKDRLISEAFFLQNRSDALRIIEASSKEVEFVLNTFKTRDYTFDGKTETLKFKGDFEKIFIAAVDEATLNWTKAKQDVAALLDEHAIDENYAKRVAEYDDMNLMLITDVNTITKLCRDEAAKQRKIATLLQSTTFVFVIAVFFWLIVFIMKNIQSPILKIRHVFAKMGSGDFDVTLERHSDDEFKALFDDFNKFVHNRNTINHIEDHILSEDNLRSVLTEMLKDFVPFVTLQRISIVYKDSFDNYSRINSDDVEIIPVGNFEIHERMICQDKMLIMPIHVNGVYLGYAEFYKETVFTEYDIKFVSGLEKKISFTFYKSLIFKDLLRIVTTGLADLTESRDPETRRHLVRMSLYSKIIAKQLYDDQAYPEIIDGEFLDNIQLVAPMHDIGKVGVPDYILLKPGKLSDEEFEQMKKHTCEGAKVLKGIHERFSTYNILYFQMAEDIAHYHQEKFNGSGYPEGISGEVIPLSARICAVADVFDALTSKRPYKEAFSLEKSYSIIKESSGSHFDPRLVKAFFDSQTSIEAVYYKYREI